MLITNKYDLPDTISRAMVKQNSLYNAGPVNTSVTSLIQSPRIALLRKKHFNDLTRDVSENFYALLGSAAHHILELGATENMIVEERLYMDIDGWKISGALDVQEIHGDEIDIYDYKVTSVYAYTMAKGGAKKEWVEQLNLQAMLVEANKPMRVRDLFIVAIFRDWSGAEAGRDATYPQTPIMKIQLPLWEKEDQIDYARKRVSLHRKAMFMDEMGEELDLCSADDRWVRDDSWAVAKKGATKALRVFSNPGDAINEVQQRGSQYEVTYRKGRSTRCQYCGVKEWCSQYQTKILPDEGEE